MAVSINIVTQNLSTKSLTTILYSFVLSHNARLPNTYGLLSRIQYILKAKSNFTLFIYISFPGIYE